MQPLFWIHVLIRFIKIDEVLAKRTFLDVLGCLFNEIEVWLETNAGVSRWV